MKDITCFLRYLTLMLCVFFTACSNDDDTQAPLFPELQKIEGVVGQTATLEFEASGNWKLASSALWCQFVVNEELMNACSGTAGKQKVTVRISNDAAELQKTHKATITMWMGGAQQIVFEVTRPILGYEIALVDHINNIEYTKENPYMVAYEALKNVTLNAKANFDWKLASWPEWVESTTVGDVAGDKSSVSISLTVKSGFTKEKATGDLKFINEGGETVATLPITYNGIPDDKIEFSNKTPYTIFTFSMDGKTYSSTSGMTEETTSDAPLPLIVTAKNDAYKIVYLIGEEQLYSRVDNPSWYTVTNDAKGNLSIKVQVNEGDERGACVMVFPQRVYDEIGDANFTQTVLDENGDIKSTYTAFIGVQFKQKGISRGFKVADESGNKLPVTWLVDENHTEAELIATYGVSNVYRLKVNKAYDVLNASTNGFDSYCMAEAAQGSNGWEGTTAQSTWTPGGKFDIRDIPEASTGEYIIRISDPMTGSLFGILILEHGTASHAAKMKIRK